MQTTLPSNTQSNQRICKNMKPIIKPNQTNISPIMLPIPCLIQQPKSNSFTQVQSWSIKKSKKKGYNLHPILTEASCFCGAPVCNQYFYSKNSKDNRTMKIKIKNSQINMNKNANGNMVMNNGFNSSFGFFIKKSRVPFSPEEDEKIKELAEKYGTRQWALIASFLVGRTPKQCRDRYANYLVPGYIKGEWSNEEDQLLTKLYTQYGPKWSILQKSFPGRSANSIKNRWNYFLCRQYKNDNEDFENKSKLCQGEYEIGTKKININDDILNSNDNESPFLDHYDTFGNDSSIQSIDLIPDVLKKGSDEVLGCIDQENEMLEILNNEIIGFENEWGAFNYEC